MLNLKTVPEVLTLTSNMLQKIKSATLKNTQTFISKIFIHQLWPLDEKKKSINKQITKAKQNDLF